MTMYQAVSSVAQGFGVTKGRALAGIADFLVSDGDFDVPSHKMKVEIAEFDAGTRFGQDEPTPWENRESWARSTDEVHLEPDAIRELAHHHQKIEEHVDLAEDWHDWRIDYGDENITYVIKSESGAVVGMEDHWDKAKEGRDECNEEWDDGEEYWIDEVEGDVELTLTGVDD